MKERILNYILQHGSITTKQAVLDLGCCDLQHYIMVLKRYYPITSEWVSGTNRHGEKVHFKKYMLGE